METYFEIPIHYSSNFGSKPKKMVPFRSDSHPKRASPVEWH